MVLAKAGSVEKVTNAPSAPAASEGKMNFCCRMTRSSFGPQALGGSASGELKTRFHKSSGNIIIAPRSRDRAQCLLRHEAY